MYRLLIPAVVMVCLVGLQPASSSDQFLELSAPKTTSLAVIGTVPPKRHIDLDLGGLRTDSARLPEGKRDLEARIRLRNRRELARRKSAAKSPSASDQKKCEERAKRPVEGRRTGCGGDNR